MQITFVGIIQKLQETSTSISFTMEDGTGVVAVSHWLESPQDAKQKANLWRLSDIEFHII